MVIGAHYFTWIPFDGSVTQSAQSAGKFVPFTPQLVNVLCQYAGADLTGKVVSFRRLYLLFIRFQLYCKDMDSSLE